ncbi:MAG: Sir2 silent information regulator family NAD-dependent deacetylase [Clostridiales bacterium]|nr:Sir2 silent information regulator family NAD-dependent deacetylase [Clostridiales bacterium]
MTFTQDCSAQIKRLQAALDSVDYVIIGAGAGLSTSAGFTYSGERFRKTFGDFEQKYNFYDMYSGGFYPYSTPEEHWAYWSRYVLINRYQDPPKPVYNELYELVKDKNYFVITTNVDHCFQKAGFDKRRLFYTQGDYGLFQCSVPCHNKTYDNEDIIRRMVAEQKDMKIPTELIPRCPICGKPMTMNLRADDKFVQDDGWDEACARYEDFVHKHKDSRILFLELGVGGNTPVIIKYPFWRLTSQNPKATYACINYGEAMCPPQIESRSICINDDIGNVLSAIKREI